MFCIRQSWRKNSNWQRWSIPQACFYSGPNGEDNKVINIEFKFDIWLKLITGRFVCYLVFPLSWRRWYWFSTCLENRRRPVSSKWNRKHYHAISLSVSFWLSHSILCRKISETKQHFHRQVLKNRDSLRQRHQQSQWVTSTLWAVATTRVLSPNAKSMTSPKGGFKSPTNLAGLKAQPTCSISAKGNRKTGSLIHHSTPKLKPYSWKGQGLQFTVMYLWIHSSPQSVLILVCCYLACRGLGEEKKPTTGVSVWLLKSKLILVLTKSFIFYSSMIEELWKSPILVPRYSSTRVQFVSPI